VGGPIHVAFLLNRLRHGGLERVCVDLVNRLDPERFRCTVVSFAPPSVDRGVLAPRVGLECPGKGRGNDPVLVLRLWTTLRRLRPDVVQTHNWGTLVEGYLAARWARVPAVVHAEHGTVEGRPRNVAVQRRVWRRVDRLLAVSEEHRRRMARTVGVPEACITIVRNGVDSERFRPQPERRAEVREALGVPASAFLAGTVGTMRPVKNQRLLLEALAGAGAGAGAGEDAPWGVLVGDGPLMDDLKAAARDLGVAERVVFAGPRDDVPDLLAALDAFVLPSRSEAMPVSLLEAMACQVAVVATRVGGIPELVTDDVEGLLVADGDAAGLADALRALKDDGARRARLAAAGRKAAVERYPMARMVGAYEGLYAELAGRAGDGTGGA